jgi:hypothetical protein
MEKIKCHKFFPRLPPAVQGQSIFMPILYLEIFRNATVHCGLQFTCYRRTRMLKIIFFSSDFFFDDQSCQGHLRSDLLSKSAYTQWV